MPQKTVSKIPSTMNVRKTFTGANQLEEPGTKRAMTTKNGISSPSKLARCRSGGAIANKQRDSNGNVYVDIYKMHMPRDSKPAIDPSSKTIESLQLENEHLNGIIAALNIKIKKTGDLEKEMQSLKQAIMNRDQSQKDLLQTIEDMTQSLHDQMVKNEKFQSLIIDENNNLKNIILEKDQQIVQQDKELADFEQQAL